LKIIWLDVASRMSWNMVVQIESDVNMSRVDENFKTFSAILHFW